MKWILERIPRPRSRSLPGKCEWTFAELMYAISTSAHLHGKVESAVSKMVWAIFNHQNTCCLYLIFIIRLVSITSPLITNE